MAQRRITNQIMTISEEMENHLEKIVLGIITHDSSILIGRLYQDKVKEFKSGSKYTFPGGKVEANESLREAVKRELFEETGLKVVPIAKIGERKHPNSERVIFYFHCHIEGGEVTTSNPENDDIDELVWVSLNEIEHYMPTLYSKVLNYLEKL